MRHLIILTLVACSSPSVRSAEPARCHQVLASELRGRARAAVGLSTQLTLALPTAWPASDNSVMFLAYPTEPLPTEIQRTRLHSPSHRIVFSPTEARLRIDQLGASIVLGTQDDTDEPVDAAVVARAEQAVVDVVTGCQTVEHAAADIGAYVQWLEHEPVIARDLTRRADAFVRWVRAGGLGSGS